jgi:pilus assembly protein Flp/PilA
MLVKFIREETGATAIEYGLIAALIAVGTSLSDLFTGVSDTIDAAAP